MPDAPPNGAPPLIPLVILLDPQSGVVKIAEGPVQDPMLCFGMLEMARLVLTQHVLRANAAPRPHIVRPDGPINLDGLIDPRARSR